MGRAQGSTGVVRTAAASLRHPLTRLAQQLGPPLQSLPTRLAPLTAMAAHSRLCSLMPAEDVWWPELCVLMALPT